MQYTDNLGLKLPEGTDFYDVDDMNYNSQLIDAAISGSGGTAADISYDNSDSGLSATNVQDAIDEVAQSGGGGVGTVINLTTLYSALFNQTVTLTGTYDTYTATFDSTGHATVNVFYVDTYAVTCQGATDSVTVTAIGLVINADVFPFAVVNITTSDSDLIGETISVYFGSDPTDVRASLTFDSNLSVSFQTEDIGTYNIVIGYSNPVSFTVSSVGGSVSVTYNPTPTGSSVTPVNNVRNWLDSAKVFDKNYTTISQVLSDTTTLQTLISSQNANDYLVRSTSWVSDVCGNSTAMSYIGLNNYSADTLLDDSTWCTAICNSTYFESVLNVKIPIMASNTTPSGTCSASNNYDDSKAYYAFDGDSAGTNWKVQDFGFPQWVQYTFSSSIKSVHIVEFRNRSIGGGVTNHSQSQTFSYSTNNTSFTDFWTPDGVTQSETLFRKSGLSLKNVRSIRATVTNSGNSPSVAIIAYIQCYGRQDV